MTLHREEVSTICSTVFVYDNPGCCLTNRSKQGAWHEGQGRPGLQQKFEPYICPKSPRTKRGKVASIFALLRPRQAQTVVSSIGHDETEISMPKVT